MHDPMIVAFEIKRPWPKRNMQSRVWKRRFWFDGYLPALVTVWHVDPEVGGDDDSCGIMKRDHKGRSGHYKLFTHVHHWKIQIRPLQKLRRWLFTRCYVCGKRLPYGYSPVCDRSGWNSEKPGFMQSEFGVRHFPDDSRCDEEAKLAWSLWREHRKQSAEMRNELRGR